MANMGQKRLELDNRMLEILSLFTYDYTKKRYASEIAKTNPYPQRTISRKLNKACELGILKYLKEGRNKLYYLDLNQAITFHILLMVESYKALDFKLKNPKLNLLLDNYNSDKIIFGSYAKSNFNKDSDIDVLFLTANEIDIMKSSFVIHSQFSSFDNFKKKIIKKEVLALEIANNHIILSGYEKIIKLLMGVYGG